eukprot:jgi/Phyca11/504906/fgenesh2_kg.PHYCAscaffold_10_\
MDGHCWNNKCPRCPAFDVDSFDPNDENALMRLPVTPFANDSITTSLCVPKEDLSRKRKRRSLDATPTTNPPVNSEQLAESTSPEPKKTKKDVNKAKKTPIEESEKKKTGQASDQGEVKKGKDAGKNTKNPERSIKTETSDVPAETVESGETSPTSGFRPHYDSVFSR